MRDAALLQDLIAISAERRPAALALSDGTRTLDYTSLHQATMRCAGGLAGLGLRRGERIAVFLEKRFEAVIAAFAAAAAGAIFVPINPLLKPAQVAHILRDCAARVLITSAERLGALEPALGRCPDLSHLVILGVLPASSSLRTACCHGWQELLAGPGRSTRRVIDGDAVAILYTSGSTGNPKGVVLSHRNMVAGARSVAAYLDNDADDVLLAALPLSFDAGFSQLTTAFQVGARVTLLNYLLPRDVLGAMARDGVTGLTAVPPLFIQLAQLPWSAAISERLRYFACTGGRLPRETLATLRAKLPATKFFLMYGLTEAFRSTYLPPEEVDRRPDSIGKAIPNAEILVLRDDGSPCAPNEPGELVHRGALVGMGYWNDLERTAERFRPLPAPVRQPGLTLPEIAVFSGDTVRMDEEGFLYYIGRGDDMIKTSGYRVSPTEVEEILHETGMIAECVAFGVADDILGQVIWVVAVAAAGAKPDSAALLAECRRRMPAYMVPAGIEFRPGPLPRNPNGKMDRKALSSAAMDRHDR